jgi:hypothetical protein
MSESLSGCYFLFQRILIQLQYESFRIVPKLNTLRIPVYDPPDGASPGTERKPDAFPAPFIIKRQGGIEEARQHIRLICSFKRPLRIPFRNCSEAVIRTSGIFEALIKPALFINYQVKQERSPTVMGDHRAEPLYSLSDGKRAGIGSAGCFDPFIAMG